MTAARIGVEPVGPLGLSKHVRFGQAADECSARAERAVVLRLVPHVITST